jgi:uncharacterized 2Fe-2S/4Fe-4S cluster protein (DUF4445 family)
MPTVVFTPSGLRGEVETGTTVLEAARYLGVDLDSVCGGKGICGRCQVTPTFGAFAKHALESDPSHLSAWGPVEAAYGGRRPLADSARLGCSARIQGDIVIDVPPASQVHRPVIRKSVDLTGLIVDPVVRLYYVDVEPGALGGDRSDLRLLLDALMRDWSLAGLSMGPAALAMLQPALEQGLGSVTAAIHGGRDIAAVWPGFVETAYGIAVDVGSTTVAGHLCDLATGEVLASAGRMNPQIRFGEDLMSRVSYVMMHPGGRATLTTAIREGLDELVGELTEAAGVARTEVVDMVLVGNPIMHHLVLGIDPTPLGTAPFALATDLPVDARAADIGVGCPHAHLHVLPCIAGHVGADAAAVVLAAGPHRSDKVTLVVDVGTNAEIVLGNRDGLLAASSPTGPAFEGAQISCGQRATAGAVERVRIDRETLEPRLKVIGCEVWSDQPGFTEGLPAPGITGVCGSGIIEAIAELYLCGVITTDGRIDSGASARSPRVVADGRTFSYVLHDGPALLCVTQNDVRAIQLAKAALFAGARLLMDRAGIDSVDRVQLAGAFGSHIDPTYALVLGLIPDCDPDAVASIGNAAGTGALMALLSASSRAEIAAVARRITKVETALEARFQEHFVQAMGFPHTTDPYARLAKVVPLPDRPTSGGTVRTRRRARAVTDIEETS